MGTTLTGTTPQDTYDSLIKVTDNGPLSGTLKALSDGLGNDSTLSLSTTAASIAGTLAVTGNATFDTNTLFVDATNNRVGVGITTPDSKVRIQNDNATVPSLTIRDGGTPTVDHIRVSSGTYGDAFFVGATGNVGIGTSSPTEKLHIVSSSDVTVRLQRTGVRELNLSSAGITASSEFLYLASDYGALSAIPLIVNGAERVRVTTNGLTFNGDTAAANALDDYEEGIWTPTISFGGASVGVTYAASRAGQYTKIGRQVTATAYILLTNKGTSTGAASIGGLPYVIGASSGFYSSACFSAISQLSYVGMLQGYGEINTNRIDLVETTEAGSQTNITDADFTNVSQVLVQVTYFV
jgi:hypothetical protein